MSRETSLPECPTRMPYTSECPTRMPYSGASSASAVRVWVPTCTPLPTSGASSASAARVSVPTCVKQTEEPWGPECIHLLSSFTVNDGWPDPIVLWTCLLGLNLSCFLGEAGEYISLFMLQDLLHNLELGHCISCGFLYLRRKNIDIYIELTSL